MRNIYSIRLGERLHEHYTSLNGREVYINNVRYIWYEAGTRTYLKSYIMDNITNKYKYNLKNANTIGKFLIAIVILGVEI